MNYVSKNEKAPINSPVREFATKSSQDTGIRDVTKHNFIDFGRVAVLILGHHEEISDTEARLEEQGRTSAAKLSVINDGNTITKEISCKILLDCGGGGGGEKGRIDRKGRRNKYLHP